MAPIRTAKTSRVHIGQPIDPHLDVGLAAHEDRPIKAHEIVGSTLDAAAQVTDNVLTVKTLLSPLSRQEVGIVRCLGLNYHHHAAETNLSKPAYPNLFYKPATSLIGPNAPIIVPTLAQPVEEHLPDYEVEFVIVVGKAAKNVSEADALDYVLGYTGANDVSFRKLQMAVSQWSFSKGFDNTNPFGPCLVSASAMPDPQVVPLKCSVNDTVLQDGNTAKHIFSVRKTVSFLSQATTLEPGAIILTGTPEGVGFVRKPPVYLKDGDKVSTWFGNGIGTLINVVREEMMIPKSGA
ncbi:hypothetical protein AX15_007216 [Amanita polypyramis BW_CC]|nr:hypothetical protein AX15_007216 [Amanita polypyramis BW_CC]